MGKFYGQFDPPVDRVIFERYFPDRESPGVFVECGAFDGETESCCKFFEESRGWTGYNIEPVPWTYEALVRNRPLSRNLNFALSNEDGKATFTAYNHPILGQNFGNGSLTHTEPHRRELEDGGCTAVRIEVERCTWRRFIESERINRVDLLVLDVEGHELSVLEGMAGCAVLPAVICIEIGHLGASAIRSSLDRLGYEYDSTSFVNMFFVRRPRATLARMARTAIKRLLGK